MSRGDDVRPDDVRPDDEKAREVRVPPGAGDAGEVSPLPPAEEVTRDLRACPPGTGTDAAVGEEVTVKLPATPSPRQARPGRRPATRPRRATPAPAEPVPGSPTPGDPQGGEAPPPVDEPAVVGEPAAPAATAIATPAEPAEPAEPAGVPAGPVTETAPPYEEDEPGGEYEPDGTSRPVARTRPVSAAGAVIALLLGLLGFALVVQLRSNATDPGLATARPEDLVRILSDLDGRQDRLRQEIASLEASQRQLASGAQGREAALEEARRRADELGILAGTLPAQGPGLEVRFVPGTDGISASTMLDAIEELRGAGAEAMQISGAGSPAVRIVASTYFSDDRDGLVADGAHLAAPYTVSVIGDPQTMHTALNIPGGVVDTVHQRGGNVIVQESDAVHVTALHQVGAPRFARPVS
jgi:uncharacterized protein YlxW (UPF0749 family)